MASASTSSSGAAPEGTEATAARDALLGCWRVGDRRTATIKSCSAVGGDSDVSGLEGSKFILYDAGNVAWIVDCDGSRETTLSACESFNVEGRAPAVAFESRRGDRLRFQIEPSEPKDSMTLTCEGWCVLNCTRYSDIVPIENYNFYLAVEHGFFSDVTIKSQGNKQFHVHSTILGLLGSEFSWFSQPPPLTGLPVEVISTIIHWLYSEYLPETLNEEIALQVIDAVKEYSCMSKLIEHCQLYLRNSNLKQQILNLVNDVYICTNQIIEYLKITRDEIGCDSTKLCLILKQSLREAATALLKIVVLCDLFAKKKTELTKEDKHEIIRFAHLSFVPEFMNQIQKIFDSLKVTFNSFSPNRRLEISTYLVPEIESALEIMSSVMFDIKVAFEQIMETLLPNYLEKDDFFNNKIEDLKAHDYTKIKNLHQKITYTVMHLLQKKECFFEMTESIKVRSILCNLDQINDELPALIFKLEEINDDLIQWKEFKSCFKMLVNKVSEILCQLITYEDAFQEVLRKICSLVQKEIFTLELMQLGILQPVDYLFSTSDTNGDIFFVETEKKYEKYSNSRSDHSVKLSLTSSILKPPADSNLSKAAEKLLQSEKFTDMVFEIPIQMTSSQGASNNKSSIELQTYFGKHLNMKSEKNHIKIQESNTSVEDSGSVFIKAHRVIVAARCDWFRRALQSGMKESIHRHIIVHDTSPNIFKKLLHYLYTGKLDIHLTTADQLTEIILLGDRYELDALKFACEQSLSLHHLDKENVFFYLNFADQYNAKYLRNSCIEYIAKKDLFMGDSFSELSPALKSEILNFSRFFWSSKKNNADCYFGRHNGIDQSNMFLLENLNIDGDSNSDCSTDDFSVDKTRLNECLEHLRHVLGPHVPIKELNRIALAADCDVNRAINFYYSQN